MKTLRTTLNLRKHDVRRLLRRGYEIEYIETRHLDNRDETVVVWTRQTQPDDLAESEVTILRQFRSAGSAIEVGPAQSRHDLLSGCAYPR